ncbi:MAG: HAD family hydrolase [Deltaproteobacteria bacterium]|nr:HAD family hydrolase [Deltaproteobacteria bacterium]
MKFKGIIFDINGTRIDIHTEEGHEEIYRAIAHFLNYQGVNIHRWQVKDEYFKIMDEQRHASQEHHPEFNVVKLWTEFLKRKIGASTTLPPEKLEQMPLFLAELYRGISLFRLQLYPEVHKLLEELHPLYQLAIVSDAQSAWALPELRQVGIASYFKPIIISGDYGFRKPDRRLFEAALSELKLQPEQALFVGNDMYHDVFGAKQLGLKTVFFSSNQGKKHMDGVEPDYIIYHFGELRQAIDFLEHKDNAEASGVNPV